jgi:hypothetical protein
MPVPGSGNRMPSLSHVMPDGGNPTVQIVTGTLPPTAIRLSVESAQKTSDWPSGANAGFRPPSVPAMALASRSDIDRRYRRPSAAYAMRVPSGEMATACRAVVISCCSCSSVNANRVTVAAGNGFSFATAAMAAAPIAAQASTSIAVRHVRHDDAWLADTGAGAVSD